MDKTKSKLAAFFGDDEEEQPHFPPAKSLDDAKLSQYASGKVRKSRREKEAEAAEAKRKEEEENAAKAYAEFIETFEGREGNARQASSAFVRAGEKAVYTPTGGAAPAQRQPATGNVFQRSPSPAAVPKPKGKRAMDSFLEEIKREQAEREAKYAGRSQGRSITALAAYEGQSGSKDRGDPLTSNIFVANLPPNITEQSLGNFFARVGPVGSVKIMWPRGDASSGPGADMTSTRKAKSTNLSGFVSYMKRRDAEEALREFDGFDWGGCVLRVGWSKAVPVTGKAMYVSNTARHRGEDSRSRSPDRRRSRSRDRDRPHHSSKRRSRSRSYDRDRSPRRRRYDSSGSRSRSPRRRSRSPVHKGLGDDDDVTDTFIRAVAAEVKGHDKKYAEMLKGREKSNSKYKFMLQRDHRRHAFYRGLLESETFKDPEFDDDGYNSVYSTDSGEESERERTRKTSLGKLARKRFEAMLRAMSGKYIDVARCMAFSLEHAEAAVEVADIIVASLLVDHTPVPRKVARLHLICDILHNSAAPVPSAWRFRQEFQARLGIVFDHLASIYHSFPGRITADLFKKQITTVVDVWEDWIVFPPEFTAELRARLEGNVSESTDNVKGKGAESDDGASKEGGRASLPASKFKASGFQPAMAPVVAAQPAPVVELQPVAEPASDDGEPMDVSDSDEELYGPPKPQPKTAPPVPTVKPAAATAADDDDVDLDGEPVADDLDGEPMYDDLDGEPVAEEDLDGEPLEDLDGEPLDDVDGEAMDDDVDGEPIAT